jgi:hypothetical protein
LYKLALALCILFHFLRLLYICSSPYLTRDTHLLNILLLGYYCVSHISDHLAIPTIIILATNPVVTTIITIAVILGILALFARNYTIIYKSIFKRNKTLKRPDLSQGTLANLILNYPPLASVLI